MTKRVKFEPDLSTYMTTFKGYERTPEMTEKLIAAISYALRANPQLRLGQMLLSARWNPSNQSLTDIANIYDEKWIELLQPKLKEQGNE